jgi:hypothetical protein
MPPDMGFDYLGMSYQERGLSKGAATVIFGLSILFVSSFSLLYTKVGLSHSCAP